MLVIYLKILTKTQKLVKLRRKLLVNYDKYITTPGFKKLTTENFDARLAQVNLASKNNIANFIRNEDLDDKLKLLNKLSKNVTLLLTKYFSFFLDKMHFRSDDGYQNLFVYQPIFNVLDLKIAKGTEYVTGWKSKGVYNSKLIAVHVTFLPNIKYFRKKIKIQFNNSPLVIEQNNYTTKNVNVNIVYDLDNWPKIPLRNFRLKNCLFRATNIT